VGGSIDGVGGEIGLTFNPGHLLLGIGYGAAGLIEGTKSYLEREFMDNTGNGRPPK
jgi:hypothetical protein